MCEHWGGSLETEHRVPKGWHEVWAGDKSFVQAFEITNFPKFSRKCRLEIAQRDAGRFRMLECQTHWEA